MKKIFIGAKISKRLTKNIADWEVKNSDLRARFHALENLHITLVPPWLEKNIEAVKEKMDLLAIRLRPFFIDFKKIAFGPDFKHPKLIWLLGESKEFGRVVKQAQEIFGQSDKREPKAHITIARFKEGDFKKSPRQKIDEIVNWPEEVKNIMLFESLGESKYNILHETAL